MMYMWYKMHNGLVAAGGQVEIDNEIVTAVRATLTARGGHIRKAELREAVEAALGRKLTETEAGLSLWAAREQFMEETSTEVVSLRGELSVASIEQSTRRRMKFAKTRVRQLEREGQRATTLARNVEATTEQRSTLHAIADKVRDVSMRCANDLRRRSKKLPDGL